MPPKSYPETPDGRYFVARNRLWRKTDPRLDETARQQWVTQLMRARRSVGQAIRAGDSAAEQLARRQVHAAKVALGERGPVWWQDGAPDEGGKHPRNSSYADWWRQYSKDE